MGSKDKDTNFVRVILLFNRATSENRSKVSVTHYLTMLMKLSTYLSYKVRETEADFWFCETRRLGMPTVNISQRNVHKLKSSKKYDQGFKLWISVHCRFIRYGGRFVVVSA